MSVSDNWNIHSALCGGITLCGGGERISARQALCPSLLQEFTFLLSIVKSLHMCDILSTQILKQHKSEMTSFSIN
jgi:hypothetical protein